MRSNRQYLLPKEIYHQTQWLIRSYPWKKAAYEAAIGKAVVMDGQPKGSGTSDPTVRDTEERLKYHDDVTAVEKALEKLPREYRSGIFNAVVYRSSYPDYAGIATWKRWRQRFVYWTAFFRGYV